MAIPRALEPSGLVLVDKPSGPSSFALVRDLRSKTGARAGHAGTLDPFATGVLLGVVVIPRVGPFAASSTAAAILSAQ